YCSLSERTSESLVEEFCDEFNYMPIIFKSYQSIDKKRKLIYHTNVMMCIANKYSIICLDSVDSKIDKQILLKSLKDDNKEIIEISENQLNSFAGNMIELVFENNSFLVMSSQAYKSLTKNQINKIEKFSKIIHSNVETIENCGGGSVRCMIAEVFN
ncbi:arginine deiminase-related protein, partial [Flavobacteriaceae bacterium]|nr:arginine deiminase-related protein [Flavobacteriaceae bacterium]